MQLSGNLGLDGIDRGVTLFINQGAQHSHWFDQLVVILSGSDLAKGGVVLAIFWGLWFGAGRDKRSLLLAALGAALAALAMARVVAYLTPKRLRPILEPSLHFVPPFSLPDQSNWTNWSSFPSDHAALFFAIVIGLWLVSRRVGVFAFLYVLVLICLPRLYVGIHYLSDLLVGFAIALLAVAIMAWRGGREWWTGFVLRAIDARPTLAYALLFLLTFQIATLFWDIRIALSYFGFQT